MPAHSRPQPPLPRTSPRSVLFTTYNLLDFGAGSPAASNGHYGEVAESIRALSTDVLAVQEIRGAGEAAGQLLQRLADDTGLSCLVPSAAGGQAAPALAPGSHGYHTGLLWRREIEPVPGSLRVRSQDLWHSLVWVILDVGGPVVRHAGYHAPPFGRRIRADQNELVVAALHVPAGRVPTLVGADWNGQSADRVREPGTGTWRLHEPGDPFAGVEWFADLVHQCDWNYDEQGRRRHWADRTAGEVLWSGGLYDAAAVLRAPWQPTTGHYSGDPFGARGIRRRIDAVRVTADMIPALRGHHVTDTALTRRASDHLPVTVEYLPSAIAGHPGDGGAGSPEDGGGRPAPG